MNALALSHYYVQQVVQPGDRTVDATAGNGGDTVFLADLVGSTGHVDAFDIQPAALDKTQYRLAAAGLAERCTLHLASHDQMADRVTSGLAAIMFNLGYLPGGDHSVGTRAESTVTALKQAMSLLRVGGIITMGIYYGGDSGFDERDAVLAFLQTVSVHDFAVQRIDLFNALNCAPVFVCLEKLR